MKKKPKSPVVLLLLVRDTYSEPFATHFTLLLTTSNNKAIAGQGPVISSLRLQKNFWGLGIIMCSMHYHQLCSFVNCVK